jgi:hypothetical protein
MINLENTKANDAQHLQQLINGLIQDVNQWRALLALTLKQTGGTVLVNQSTDVENPFEIVTRMVQEPEQERKLEIRLLEGKEEIESVLGKPSPIIVPK